MTDEERLDNTINPKPAPYTDAASFMAHTADAQPPAPFSDPGAEALHSTGAHEVKMAGGLGLGGVQGDGASDPNALFNAAVKLDGNYSPEYDYIKRQMFQQSLKDNPAAGEKFNEQQADAKRVTDTQSTPAMEAVRSRVPIDYRRDFDARLAQERLDQAFPPADPNSDTDERGYKKGSYAAEHPIKQTPQEMFVEKRNDVNSQIIRLMQTGDKAEAEKLMNVMQIIDNRIDAGTMKGPAAMLALERIEWGDNSTITKGGRELAESLGMSGRTVNGDVYGLDDVIPGMAKGELAAGEARGEERYNDYVSEQQGKQEAQDKITKAEADKAIKDKKAEADEITWSDGTKRKVIRYPNGSVSVIGDQGEKDEKLPQGGINSSGPYLYFTGPDDKTEPLSKEEYWLGSDGSITPRVPIVAVDDDNKKYYTGEYEPVVPKAGVTDVTFGEENTSTNPEDYKAGETVDRAGKTWKKRADGNWEEVTDA